MDLGEALVTALKDASEVTDLVGAGAGARLYWTKRDQGSAVPALVLSAAGGSPDDLDLAGDTDIQESRVQLSCLAGSHAVARSLAKAASDALLALDEVGDMLFWEGEAERPIDLGSEAIGGKFIHEVVQDVILRHSPSA